MPAMHAARSPTCNVRMESAADLGAHGPLAFPGAPVLAFDYRGIGNAVLCGPGRAVSGIMSN